MFYSAPVAAENERPAQARASKAEDGFDHKCCVVEVHMMLGAPCGRDGELLAPATWPLTQTQTDQVSVDSPAAIDRAKAQGEEAGRPTALSGQPTANNTKGH